MRTPVTLIKCEGCGRIKRDMEWVDLNPIQLRVLAVNYTVRYLAKPCPTCLPHLMKGGTA